MGDIIQTENVLLGEKTGISDIELMTIARSIDRTPVVNGRTIDSAEFAWLYTPGLPLQLLKPSSSDIAQLLMRESAYVSESFSGTIAVAHIHNHDRGTIHPTFTDIQRLLTAMSDNEHLAYALIAETETGQVTGFYELEFIGDRATVPELIQRNKDLYSQRLQAKQLWFDQHPEEYAKLTVGDAVLSLAESRQLVLDVMVQSSISGKGRPLKGYRFENWRFIALPV